ncbi:hypothetical protein Efla_002928 [Eimeria flavescens]
MPGNVHFAASVFTLLFLTYAITQFSTATQIHGNQTQKPTEPGPRRIIVRKRCPPPKCCNVVEHVTRTRFPSEQKAAVAEKELLQIEKAHLHNEEKEEEFERQRIAHEEEEAKRHQQLADSLAAEEKKLTHALEEELAALETEVESAEADKHAAEAHLDALVAEATGEESHEEAKHKREEADRQAEHEKAELEEKEAMRVAAIARHLAKETTDKLHEVADNVESASVSHEAESVGRAEADALAAIQKSEEQAVLAESEEAETTHDDEGERGQEEEEAANPGAPREEAESEQAENADDETFLHVRGAADEGKLRHLGTRKRRLKEHKIAISDDLAPNALSVQAGKTAEREERDAEPRVEEGEEDLPDLWFGNRGADERVLQSENKNKKIKLTWWQRIFG